MKETLNKKVPGLSRTVVYTFLIGLIVGGGFIALIDAFAKKPLFSQATLSISRSWCDSFSSDTAFCNDTTGWYSDWEFGGSGGGVAERPYMDPGTLCGYIGCEYDAGTNSNNTNNHSNSNNSPNNNQAQNTRVVGGRTCLDWYVVTVGSTEIPVCNRYQ